MESAGFEASERRPGVAWRMDSPQRARHAKQAVCAPWKGRRNVMLSRLLLELPT